MWYISLEKFPTNPWFEASSQVALFLKSCKDVRNPEALYRQGMASFYFRRFDYPIWINIYILFVVNLFGIEFFFNS